MAPSDDIAAEVQTTISTAWDKRDGRKIPETEEVALAGGAVEINATFLYADLADSSKLAKELDRYSMSQDVLQSPNNSSSIAFDNAIFLLLAASLQVLR